MISAISSTLKYCNSAKIIRHLQKRKIHVSYRDEFFCPLPPGHTFPMEKYPLLYQILHDELKIIRDEDVLKPEMISFEDLALVHTQAYLQKFQEPYSLSEADVRKLGIPW